MSNTGGSDAQNDDEDDIYKDIGDFHFDKELSKLEEKNKAYSEDIIRLSERLKQLTDKNEELQNINDILATNISILLKTAKAEIDRKQNVIDELRKKLDLCYKKGFHTEKRSRMCQRVAYEPSKESQDVNEIEEGEIVKDDVVEIDLEEKKYYNYKGKRDCKKEGSDEDLRVQFRGKHSSTHGRRSSRHIEESRTRHSSSISKSRYGFDSFDRRRDPDKREKAEPRKRRRHSPNSDHSSGSYKMSRRSRRKNDDPKYHNTRHSHSSSSHRRENSCESSGRRSEKKSGNPSVETSLEVNVDSKFLSSKSENECVKELNRRETPKKEKNDGVKKLKIEEYYQKRNSENDKKCGKEVFTRQSVLDDLYDEPKTTGMLSNSDPVRSPQRNIGNEDWVESHVRNKPEPARIKTLYSRRMEAKLQQQVNEEKFNAAEDKAESPKKDDNLTKDEKECNVQQKKSKIESKNATEKKEKTGPLETDDLVREEKEEGELTFDDDISETNDNQECMTYQEEASTNGETVGNLSCKNIDSFEVNKNQQSFGESLIIKLLQLQKSGEDSGIKEFSPLKNNYKLSKISPVKPAPNQHILEYYNLKPSGQQLTNIEPEILDFSHCLPETPGKNFTHPFCISGEPQNCENPKGVDDDSLKDNKTSPNAESGHITSSGCDKRRTSPDLEFKTNSKTSRKNSESDNISSGNENRDLGNKKCSKVNEKEKSYHLRTRSKTRNERKKSSGANGTEAESRRTEEGKRKRKPEVEAELNTPVKRKRQTPNEYEREKTEGRGESTTKETFIDSVSRPVVDETIALEDSCRLEDNTAENISQNGEKMDEIPSAEISGDSSTFKVLRNYLMLSANDDSEADDFSCSSSGEYSDSGASAFVDLL